MYRRVRRNIGPQPLRPGRLWTGITIFSALLIVFAVLLGRHPAVLPGLAGGAAAGALLGWIGLRLTRFETNENGHFYTPNTYLGVTLSLLLVGRLVYRFTQFSTASHVGGAPTPGAAWSPLTMAVFGLMAGYYVAYYAGVLVRGRAHVAGTR
jgi:hypothetical protein